YAAAAAAGAGPGDVVVEREGRVARVVVVVAGQRQSVAVAGGQVAGDVVPGSGVGAGPGDQRGRGAGGVVGQRDQRPVVGWRVGTGLLVPERDAGRSRGRGEGLRGGAVAVGRAAAAELRALRPAVAARAGDAGRAGRAPAA